MSDRWPRVPLGSFSRHRTEPIFIDDRTRYKRCRVQLHARGIALRDLVDGVAIDTKKQWIARADDFLVAEIDAKVGGYGIVPPELDGAIVSSHYFLFEPDLSQVIPEWIGLYSKTPEFFDQVAARGSTNYSAIRPKAVQAFQFPLPPLDEQKRIVAKVQEALGALDRAATLHTQTVADFDRLLISIARDRGMFEAPKEPMAQLAPLVRRPVEVDLFGRYPELGVRSFGKGTFHKPVLEGIEVGTKKLFWIKPGDLLFQIVFAWEGAVAIATDKDDGRCGSHRFLSCVCDPNKVLAEWLRLYFLSREGLSLLGEASPGGAGRNRTLGLEKLARIQVPVPNLDDQEVIREITRKRDELTAADTFQSDADALRRAILSKAFRGEL